jgi:hypothetical protein
MSKAGTAREPLRSNSARTVVGTFPFRRGFLATLSGFLANIVAVLTGASDPLATETEAV